MISLQELALERRKVIDEWGRFLVNDLAKAIKKYGIGYSNALLYSLHYSLVGDGGGDVASVKHEFNYYGKFVDMGVGRGWKLESVRSNRELVKASGIGGGRRAKKWESKTYYGEVITLRDLLLNKYGEQALGIVREVTAQTLQLNF